MKSDDITKIGGWHADKGIVQFCLWLSFFCFSLQRSENRSRAVLLISKAKWFVGTVRLPRLPSIYRSYTLSWTIFTARREGQQSRGWCETRFGSHLLVLWWGNCLLSVLGGLCAFRRSSEVQEEMKVRLWRYLGRVYTCLVFSETHPEGNWIFHLHYKRSDRLPLPLFVFSSQPESGSNKN